MKPKPKPNKLRYRAINHHYTESGLSNVHIRCSVVVDDAGEEVALVVRINQVHKLIAEHLVHTDGALGGDEIKFLRGMMGLTQKQLGAQIHRTRPTIARWESGQSAIDGAADALIRLLAIAKLKLRAATPAKISQKCAPRDQPKPAIYIKSPAEKGRPPAYLYAA